MFTDESEILVKAGDGGNGCVSFRREKFVPFGGPDGGDGGKGGDIILKVNKSLRALSHIKSHRFFKAKSGGKGGKNDRTGKGGETYLIEVPIGTIVKDSETKDTICDLSEEDSEYTIAKGGKGGKGNSRFRSSTNQAPKYAQPGEEGDSGHYLLELKLIADIGLVGFPNAGKSTLLSRLSKAHPKIANYPFTTLYPNLGVVYVREYDTFVMADIPGLIEGAHQGVGLGIRFLKHIERTKGLVFMIDLFEENPFQQFLMLMKELESYHPKMLKKPYYIALNKTDLFKVEQKQNLFDEFLKKYKESPFYSIENDVKLFLISAATGEGLEDLKNELYLLIELVDKKEIKSDAV